MPEAKVANRVICPHCGNDTSFFEIADDVVITTHYVQNTDGSFTLEENSSQPFGSIKFFCGKCEEDLSQFHQRFKEMIF